MQTIETTTDTTKAAWATPVIESYDVAELTLGAGNNSGDAINSLS